MRIDAGRYTVRLAASEDDVAAAQRLRYRVFVEEKGATPDPADAAEQRERDRFDPWCDHLLLIDNESDDPAIERGVVGVYRLLRRARAREGIGFYSASEYDLTVLEEHPGETLELGRSCVDAGHRGGTGMHLIWAGLGQYVGMHDIAIMFGVASFHGTDPQAIAQALSYLHHNHLAPPDLRVSARPDSRAEMDLLPPGQVDKDEAMRQMPALIKAYLRLGGCVGEGAWIDHDFNTVDVCLLLDTARMVDRYQKFYSRQRGTEADRIVG